MPKDSSTLGVRPRASGAFGAMSRGGRGIRDPSPDKGWIPAPAPRFRSREGSQKARHDHVGRTKSSDRHRQNQLSLTATSSTSILHRTITNTDGNNKQVSALSAVKRSHLSLVDRSQGSDRIHTRPFSPFPLEIPVFHGCHESRERNTLSCSPYLSSHRHHPAGIRGVTLLHHF